MARFSRDAPLENLYQVMVSYSIVLHEQVILILRVATRLLEGIRLNISTVRQI